MKLYYAPGVCSLSPHILLRETKLPVTLVRVDLKTHLTADGVDHYTINSKGSVPVLELDDGTRFTEGPVVAQMICDRAGRTDLMPAAGTIERYRVMEWQNYVTSELHKSYSPLFNPDFDENGKAFLRTALRKKYEWLAQQLANKPYLTGETFTAADAYLFTVTRWAKAVRVELADLAPIRNFMERVAARPAAVEAMHVEGLPVHKAA